MYTTKTLFSDKKSLLAVTFFMLLANTIAQGIPYAIKRLSDGVTGIPLPLLAAVAAGLVLTGFIRYCSDMLADKYYFKFSGKLGFTMLRDLIGIAIASDKKIFSSMNPNQLARMATSDMEALKGKVLSRYFSLISVVIQVVTLAFFVLALDWLLGLMTVTWYAIFYFATHRKIDGIQAKRMAERAAYSKVLSFTKDAIYGNFDVKYYAEKNSFLGKFDDLNQTYIRRNVDMAISSSFPRYFSYIGSFVSIAILILYKALFKPDVSTGTLLAMYMYTNNYASIFSSILNLRSNGKDIAALIKPVDDFFEIARSALGADAVDCGSIDAVEVHDLTVKYDGKTVIESLSATLEKGYIYFISGKSGVGKSTLVNAMLGEIAYEGRVRYNGVDLSAIRRESVQQRVGIVRQNMYLLNATVRDNITMFGSDFTERQIQAAADATHVRDLEHEIGTSEIDKVSGGERKRIALARLLLCLHKKDFVILDETFANIDNATIRKLVAGVLANTAGKILVVVTHDQAVKDIFPAERVREIAL